MSQSSDIPGKVFSAVLYPNQSLSLRGYWLVMSVVGAVNLAFGAFFASVGAWPALFILLIVFLSVWLAFELSYQNARQFERIDISENEMRVLKVDPNGNEQCAFFQPYWTRIEVAKHDRRPAEIFVTSKDKTVIVGSFLAPSERPRLVRSLELALMRAKS